MVIKSSISLCSIFVYQKINVDDNMLVFNQPGKICPKGFI